LEAGANPWQGRPRRQISPTTTATHLNFCCSPPYRSYPMLRQTASAGQNVVVGVRYRTFATHDRERKAIRWQSESCLYHKVDAFGRRAHRGLNAELLGHTDRHCWFRRPRRIKKTGPAFGCSVNHHPEDETPVLLPSSSGALTRKSPREVSWSWSIRHLRLSNSAQHRTDTRNSARTNDDLVTSGTRRYRGSQQSEYSELKNEVAYCAYPNFRLCGLPYCSPTGRLIAATTKRMHRGWRDSRPGSSRRRTPLCVSALGRRNRR